MNHKIVTFTSPPKSNSLCKHYLTVFQPVFRPVCAKATLQSYFLKQDFPVSADVQVRLNLRKKKRGRPLVVQQQQFKELSPQFKDKLGQILDLANKKHSVNLIKAKDKGEDTSIPRVFFNKLFKPHNSVILQEKSRILTADQKGKMRKLTAQTQQTPLPRSRKSRRIKLGGFSEWFGIGKCKIRIQTAKSDLQQDIFY